MKSRGILFYCLLSPSFSQQLAAPVSYGIAVPGIVTPNVVALSQYGYPGPSQVASNIFPQTAQTTNAASSQYPQNAVNAQYPQSTIQPFGPFTTLQQSQNAQQQIIQQQQLQQLQQQQQQQQLQQQQQQLRLPAAEPAVNSNTPRRRRPVEERAGVPVNLIRSAPVATSPIVNPTIADRSLAIASSPVASGPAGGGSPVGSGSSSSSPVVPFAAPMIASAVVGHYGESLVNPGSSPTSSSATEDFAARFAIRVPRPASFAPPTSPDASSAIYKPPAEDPCGVAPNPCACYLLGGACGWSTTRNACDSVSNTECMECPFMPGCECRSGSACGCVKLGPPCGWSRTARACLKGFTTECEECNDQEKCSGGGGGGGEDPYPPRTSEPTPLPTQKPTTRAPTSRPTSQPTRRPTARPTPAPKPPTAMPSPAPTTPAPTLQNIELSADQKEILVRWVYSSRPYATIYGALGQSLRFIFDNQHDVWAFRTLTAYDTCNFTRAVLQADTDIGGGVAPWTNSFRVLFDRPGILLFACSQDDHCRAGNMRLRVEVAGS